MPHPLLLSIEGQSQGKIEGSTKVSGQEGKILVQAVDHPIEVPCSPQTGAPTGKRVHHPMTLLKEHDKSTPKLLQALVTGEQLKNVTLEFYRISPKGTEEKYYVVKLENAFITSIKSWTPNCLDSTNKQIGHMEHVSFAYEKINWTYEPDGIEAEDKWFASST